MASRVKYRYNIELKVLVTEDKPEDATSWLSFKNVSACVVSYALNSIPSASVAFALGTTAGGIDYRKTFQQLLDAIAVRPKKVQVLVTEHLDVVKSVTKVFEGNSGGFSWVRSGTETSLVLQLRHWLHWLHAASALTTAMHPSSTGDFSRAAIESVRLDSLNQNTGIEKAGWVDGQGKPIDVTRAVETDIWGQLIHPFLTDIVNSKQVEDHPLATENAYLEREVKAALAKTNLPSNGLLGANTAPPLALSFMSAANTPRIGKEATAASVFRTIRQVAKSNFHQTTLWAKLIGEFAQQFLFDVVPMVDQAFIVPSIGAYRGKYSATLTLSEQANVELSGEVSQYIRGVVLPFNSEVDTGIVDKSALPFFVFDRAYATYMSHLPGSLLFVPPPFWLSDVSGHVSNAAEGQATKPNANGAMPAQPVHTSMDEQPSTPVPDPDKPAVQITQALRDNQSMANAWAHQVFNNELLKTRTGTVITQPRFDIAPGSHIRVELPKELQLKVTASGDVFGSISNYLFAKVVQTVVSFDSQKQQASTTFVLSHCRTEAEDSQDDFSIPEPALYAAGWGGGPISKPFNYIT